MTSNFRLGVPCAWEEYIGEKAKTDQRRKKQNKTTYRSIRKQIVPELLKFLRRQLRLDFFAKGNAGKFFA